MKIIKKEINYDDQVAIMKILSVHHTIFKTFFSLGVPLFTRRIPTAAVGFDKNGSCIYMLLNPDFWDSLDIINKAFVISHECLHVVLNHGKRGNQHKNQEEVNKAQDIVNNEMLIFAFGFNRYDITNWEKYCFIDTIFTKEMIIEQNIIKNGTFEYYLDLMQSNEIKSEQKTVDHHSSKLTDEISDLNDLSKQEIQDLIDGAKEFSEEMSGSLESVVDEELSFSEKLEFKNNLGEELKQTVDDHNSNSNNVGNIPFGAYLTVRIPSPKKQKGWESIVKKHVKTLLKKETVESPSWLSRKRIHQCLSEDLMVQGVWNQELHVADKVDLVFFLDASGSCKRHAQRFVKLLKSIPEDKFNITAYSFDTSLYLIDLNDDDIQGWGGTRFTPLNDKIEEITKEKRHPDAIFVLSDGDGNRFYPEKPKLWHWILTPRHNLSYIPKESIKHKMECFEK